jgi:hypothetical protein
MTMDCLEFRRAAGADPTHLSADARAHRDSCQRCAEYHRQLLDMDRRILDALRVPVPSDAQAGGGSRVLKFPTIERRRWLALAASIVAGVLIGTLLWVGEPRESLAREVVAHIQHESGSMVATSSPADPQEVAAVLDRAGIRLRPGVGMVSYARSCPFRGETVPHLVVQTDSGPVTVLVLSHEKIKRPMKFDEQGYAGTILPAGPGSVAVVGNESDADLDQVAERIRAAVEWK